MPHALPSQIAIVRDGFFISRRLTAAITDTVPIARNLVKEHFERRPLSMVEVMITSPTSIPQRATMAQATAADIPTKNYAGQSLSCAQKPHDLYSLTVLAPKNTVCILLNAKRLRRRPREITATLVWAFVEVDQLCRKGARERRIALTRHEMGTHVLPKDKVRELYKIEARMEAEAEKATRQIVGKAIRQNRQAEAAARQETASAKTPPANAAAVPAAPAQNTPVAR